MRTLQQSAFVGGILEPTAVLRLALLYAHLLLCVFALHTVLAADRRVLRKRIGATQLMAVHHRVLLLLTGLWLTGLGIVGIDLAWRFGEIAQHPKLAAKMLSVCVLSLNAFALRYYCFPRLLAERRLGRGEVAILMTCGAVSTASWLAAAFFGLARPLQSWSLASTTGLYLLALAAAIALALWLGPRLTLRRPRGDTALEEAAETLDLRVR